MIAHEQLLEDVFAAYYDARVNKRNTHAQLGFEVNLEANLVALVGDIEHRRHEVGSSVCFIVKRPVKREVFAAGFRDRVVHHLLFNYLSPMFERIFIADCYSCRKGRGTLYGVRRVAQHIRRCSENFKRSAYVLKLDISGYFMSINRPRLLDMLYHTLDKYADRLCGHGSLRWRDYLDYDMMRCLLSLVVLNNPIVHCRFKSSSQEWQGLPRNKSLFYAAPDCGLPIGNLTSQLFSNVYMSHLDNDMKRAEHQRYYGRYVDDIVLVHRSKSVLQGLRQRIAAKLEAQGMKLHPTKCYLLHVSKGFEFLGIRQRRGVLVPGKRMKHRMNATLAEYVAAARHGLDYVQLYRFLARINSYMGLLLHTSAMGIRHRVQSLLYGLPVAYLLVDGKLGKVVVNENERSACLAALTAP